MSGAVQRAWLRFLVRLLPRGFRDCYEEDLLVTLEDWRCDPIRSGLLPPMLAATWFLIRAAVQERLSPSVAEARNNHRTKGLGMATFLRDVRTTLRALAKRPGFTSIALLTLAIGVGANTAIFSIVNAVVLRPLPYPDPESLVQIRRIDDGEPDQRHAVSQIDLEDVAEAAGSLPAIAGYQSTSVTLTGHGEPQIVRAGAVTNGLLEIFGLSPSKGRDLSALDNLPTAPRLAVVSQTVVDRYLSGIPNAVGQVLELDGIAHEVIGVAPPGFDFPNQAELWTPLYTDTEGCGRGCRLLTGIARRGPDTSSQAATEELALISARLAADHPASNRAVSFVMTDLLEAQLGNTRKGLLVLLSAVGLVLLIAAANLASLQIARSSTRRTEMGVRYSLGASRAQLCWLILTETLLLGLGGALLGTGFAGALIRVVVALAPAGVPRLDQAAIDGTVLAFALVMSLGASFLLVLIPAWRVAGSSISRSSRSTEDLGDVRARNLLMVGEVALSLVLLISSGLLLKTHEKILAVDLGFEPENVASFFVGLPDGKYDDAENVVRYFQRLRVELEALPSVESVGGVLGRPFSGNTLGTSFRFLDEPVPEPGQESKIRFRATMPGYHETLEIPVLEGRTIDGTDRLGSLPVAVVNQAFVDRYAGGRDPGGRQIQLDLSFGLDEPPRTLIGVVGNTQTESLTSASLPEVFIPQSQVAAPWMSVVIRSQQPPNWKVITGAAMTVDPTIPLRTKETMVEAVDRARGPSRFYFLLLASFAVVAVVLSAIGLFGVISYLVSRRTREIAVRLAVGAEPAAVVRHFIAEGFRPVAAGVVLGLVAALVGTKWLSTLLFGVEPFDLQVYVAVIGALLAIVLFSLLLPALRAGKIAPAQALRNE